VNFLPIILKNLPPPMAHNGSLLPQSDLKPDYDPASTEDYSQKTTVKLLASLEASDIKVTMPFATDAQCKKISKTILDLQKDIVKEEIYVYKPNVDIELGDKLGDGVVNSIDYNYQDSSQFLISVTVGPMWRGASSWDNSVYSMNSERVELDGVVLSVYDNNSGVQVDLNKLGVMDCVNGTKHKLEKGDVVSVTVYNNPVWYND